MFPHLLLLKSFCEDESDENLVFLTAVDMKWLLAIFDLFPGFLQSKKHANKVKRYLAIHGMETLKGETKKLDSDQVIQLPC